jgi:hypothetical protein
VRRCVWSRNLKNEEAMTRIGSQRHREKTPYNYDLCVHFNQELGFRVVKLALSQLNWWARFVIIFHFNWQIQIDFCASVTNPTPANYEVRINGHMSSAGSLLRITGHTCTLNHGNLRDGTWAESGFRFTLSIASLLWLITHVSNRFRPFCTVAKNA